MRDLAGLFAVGFFAVLAFATLLGLVVLIVVYVPLGWVLSVLGAVMFVCVCVIAGLFVKGTGSW